MELPLLWQDENGVALFRVDDVVLAIDDHDLGDDFTVNLRGDELVRADYLITGILACGSGCYLWYMVRICPKSLERLNGRDRWLHR